MVSQKGWSDDLIVLAGSDIECGRAILKAAGWVPVLGVDQSTSVKAL
jgi:hypothetical protein